MGTPNICIFQLDYSRVFKVLKTNDLTPVKVIGVIDRLFPLLLAWIDGACRRMHHQFPCDSRSVIIRTTGSPLPQTIFTCLYLHPESLFALRREYSSKSSTPVASSTDGLVAMLSSLKVEAQSTSERMVRSILLDLSLKSTARFTCRQHGRHSFCTLAA